MSVVSLAPDGSGIGGSGAALDIGFPADFAEAITWAINRGVVLPAVFYGDLPAAARSFAWTVSGLTTLAQIEHVRDLAAQAVADGGTLREFQRAVEQDDEVLALPAGRVETVFRNAVQTAYHAGRWEHYEASREALPYLMYDAINDSRTRPAHRAMDGTIRRIDDPWWATHSPPCGHNCRCGTIQLTAEQAKARGGATDNPRGEADEGWGHNPRIGHEADLAALEAARLDQLPPTLSGRVREFLASGRSGKLQAGWSTVDISGGMQNDDGLIDEVRRAKLAGDAEAFVLGNGRRNGREFFVAYDLRDGREVGRGGGVAEDMAFLPTDLVQVLSERAARVMLHHNHPNGFSLSLKDISVLFGHPGLHELIVHGHDGSSFGARRLLGGDVSPQLAAARSEHTRQLRLLMQRGVAATGLEAHLLNTALARAGLIAYRYVLDASRSAAYAAEAALFEQAIVAVTDAVLRAAPPPRVRR